MKWIGAVLITIVILLTVLYLGLPLFIYGAKGAFYFVFDPDLTYAANAILYIKSGIIEYVYHPGAPTIMSLVFALFPLRIFSEYFLKINFFDWSFNNIEFLMLYLRYFQLMIFGISLYIFINLIKKSFNSLIIAALAFLAYFGLTTNMPQAISVSPENFSFLITSVWLSLFVKFTERRIYLISVLLAFLAGLLFANKIIGILLFVPSVFLPFYIPKNNSLGRWQMVLGNTGIYLSGFLIGILPGIKKIFLTLSWFLYRLNNRDGNGIGTELIFDFKSALSSAEYLIRSQPVAFVVICFSLLLMVYHLFRKSLKAKDPYILLYLTGLFGIIAFARYPFARFNYVNYILVIFGASYFLSKMSRVFGFVLLIPLFLAFAINVPASIRETSIWIDGVLRSATDEQRKSMIYEWTNYEWTPGVKAGGDVFREQLNPK